MDEKTATALAGLATKLGVGVEYLWAILVQQAWVSGIIDGGILVAVWAVFILWTCYFRKRYSRWDVDLAYGGIVATVILGLFLFTVTAVCLPNIVVAFINPEYWALKQILR